jgi:hypothetical protein
VTFRVGQQVLLRGPHEDDADNEPPVICDIKPVTAVEDSAGRIALFLAAGTPTLMSRPRVPGAPKPWRPGEWDLVSAAWDRWNTLLVHGPGEWRSTWLQWTPGWEFLGWYVNLQEPLRRTRWGFDVRDLQLDVLVAPDRTWRWKDEDDFERSIACGLINEAHAAATRESARGAIAEIENAGGPFAEGVERWRPPAGWTMPALPEGNDLEAARRWNAEDCIERF